MRKWTKIELYIWLIFITSAIFNSFGNRARGSHGFSSCNNLSECLLFFTDLSTTSEVRGYFSASVCRKINGTAFVTTSPILLPSVNKYQYRSNLRDGLRNATATIFLKHYISNFRYRLPTLFMTCDLWPAKKPCRFSHASGYLTLLVNKIRGKNNLDTATTYTSITGPQNKHCETILELYLNFKAKLNFSLDHIFNYIMPPWQKKS